MTYWIDLEKNGEPFVFEDYFLDGVFFPARKTPLFLADFADYELDLCTLCHMDRNCHPIGERGEKYCTILFHDVIRPQWSLEDVL